jgi:hypothetical protein
VATLKTNHIGRRHTGRIFIGGSLHEPDQAAGQWQATPLDLFQAYLNAVPSQPDIFPGAPVDAFCNWCVYSRTQRAADLPDYASHITGNVLHTKVHWLRSRDD